MIDKYKTFEKNLKSKPHVVILGAGASCATIPQGDKNGLKITCMSNFLKNIGKESILEGVNLETKSNNIEDIYTEIYLKSKIDSSYEVIKNDLENSILEHFSQYEIPDSPTIYDFLLLGLTEKDLVATFNWDSLIVQAGLRLIKNNIIIDSKLPKILFLHGNVSVEFDYKSCKFNLFAKSLHKDKIKLLYPIKEKNYKDDIFINDSWKMLKNYLNKAYILTVFGYSAPNSDVEAKNILKNSWGNPKDRFLEQIEIIDIKPINELSEIWKDFIYESHVDYIKSFYDSMIFKFPRRTTQALFDGSMNSLWLSNERGFKENMTFEELKEYLKPLLFDEIFNQSNVTDPYIVNNKLDK